MWNLFGIEFSLFKYLLIYGRRITVYEYNVETVDYWKRNQMFVIQNSLNGGDKFMDFLRSNNGRLACDWWKWTMKEKNFNEEMKDNKVKHCDTIVMLATLEAEMYVEWLSISTEAQDMIFYVNLDALMMLNEMDRQMMICNDDIYKHVIFGGRIIGQSLVFGYSMLLEDEENSMLYRPAKLMIYNVR